MQLHASCAHSSGTPQDEGKRCRNQNTQRHTQASEKREREKSPAALVWLIFIQLWAPTIVSTLQFPSNKATTPPPLFAASVPCLKYSKSCIMRVCVCNGRPSESRPSLSLWRGGRRRNFECVFLSVQHTNVCTLSRGTCLVSQTTAQVLI